MPGRKHRLGAVWDCIAYLGPEYLLLYAAIVFIVWSLVPLVEPRILILR